MKCGVRFCGGCNPGYDRGQALRVLKEQLPDIEFIHATEGTLHDLLLVIGGCSSCCASYDQFESKNGVLKMWDKAHIDKILDTIRDNK